MAEAARHMQHEKTCMKEASSAIMRGQATSAPSVLHHVCRSHPPLYSTQAPPLLDAFHQHNHCALVSSIFSLVCDKAIVLDPEDDQTAAVLNITSTQVQVPFQGWVWPSWPPNDITLHSEVHDCPRADATYPTSCIHHVLCDALRCASEALYMAMVLLQDSLRAKVLSVKFEPDMYIRVLGRSTLTTIWRAVEPD